MEGLCRRVGPHRRISIFAPYACSNGFGRLAQCERRAELRHCLLDAPACTRTRALRTRALAHRCCTVGLTATRPPRMTRRAAMTGARLENSAIWSRARASGGLDPPLQVIHIVRPG